MVISVCKINVRNLLLENTSRNVDGTVVCSPGEYGKNCQFRCSNHCYNNKVCDPFFGNCSKCADGFQNAKCDKRKLCFKLSVFCILLVWNRVYEK